MRSKGMSLTSVLVTCTIAAVISLSLARMLSMNLRFAGGVTQKGDYNDILNTIRLATSSNNFCKCNFLNGSVPTSFDESDAATFSISVTALKGYDASCNPRNTFLEAPPTAPAGKLWVKSLTIKDFSKIDAQNYSAKLYVQVIKPQGSLGGDTYNKNFQALFTANTTSSVVTLTDCEIQSGTRNVSSTSSNSVGNGTISSGSFFGAKIGSSTSSATHQVQTNQSFCVTNSTLGTATCTVPADKVLSIIGGVSGTNGYCVMDGYFVTPAFPYNFAPGTQIEFSHAGIAGSSCHFSGQVIDLAKFNGRAGTFFGGKINSSTSSAVYNIHTNQSFCSANTAAGTLTCVVPTGKILSVNSGFGYCAVNGYHTSSLGGSPSWVPNAPFNFSAGSQVQFTVVGVAGSGCNITGVVLDE